MKITVVGAGAMGASYGGLLAASGHQVDLVDVWEDHVAAINRDGLRIDGVLGSHTLKIPATLPPGAEGQADMAIVFVDSNNTRAGAETAARVLGDDGYAVTFQNGIGNIEILQDVLGPDRVVGGSSMCSAATLGPGHVTLTNMGPNSAGEIGGGSSPRVEAMLDALRGAGFDTHLEPNIMGMIWQKFVVNCAFNAISAVTGLRAGEVRRQPEAAAYQDKVLAEVMAVIEAKKITLPDPDIAEKITIMSRKKFNRPSMLQHVDAGRKTEIDALNVALLREAKSLGIAMPYNESLVALLKGRELARIRAVHEPDLDYDAWEARAAAGEED